MVTYVGQLPGAYMRTVQYDKKKAAKPSLLVYSR